MLKYVFSVPRRMPSGVQDEVQSMLRADQVERLGLSKHMRRDIGMDGDFAVSRNRRPLPGNKFLL